MAINYVKRILDSLDIEYSGNCIEIDERGYNNDVFLVKGAGLVVKIIRSSEEHGKNEVRVLKYIHEKNIDVPIPNVVCSDFSKEIVPCAFLVMELIPGLTLKSYVKQNLCVDGVFRELGEIKGKLNSVKNEKFGNFSKPIKDTYSDLLRDEWRKVLNKLQAAEHDEAFVDRHNVYFHKNVDLTRNDVGPCLVHGDSSLNNILVEKGSVCGIIDFEFGQWGCGIQDLFGGVRSFDVLYANRVALLEGYSKHVLVPEELENLIVFYQWFACVKRLSRVKQMSWRNLSKEETRRRKEALRKKLIGKLLTLSKECRLR